MLSLIGTVETSQPGDIAPCVSHYITATDSVAGLRCNWRHQACALAKRGFDTKMQLQNGVERRLDRKKME